MNIEERLAQAEQRLNELLTKRSAFNERLDKLEEQISLLEAMDDLANTKSVPCTSSDDNIQYTIKRSIVIDNELIKQIIDYTNKGGSWHKVQDKPGMQDGYYATICLLTGAFVCYINEDSNYRSIHFCPIDTEISKENTVVNKSYLDGLISIVGINSALVNKDTYYEFEKDILDNRNLFFPLEFSIYFGSEE